MKRFDERERGLLRSLFELRYLATRQIWETWYPEKSLGACGQRLRKLRRDGFVVGARINNDRWQFAWQLGGDGIRVLRRLFDGDFEPHKPLSMVGLPHLLDTNQIYLALSCGAQAWGGGQFEWLGSHRAMLEYSTHKGPSQLHPDAIITPAATTEARVLIELDRGTEALRGDLQRATIERKIERFADTGEKVVQAHFRDTRPVRLLFVVPAGAQKRKANLLSVRDKLWHNRKLIGKERVGVVCLDEVDAIRKACGVLAVSPAALEARPPDPKRSGLSVAERALFRELFGVAAQFSERWRRLVANGEMTRSRAQARFAAIEKRLTEILGAPPIEPDHASAQYAAPAVDVAGGAGAEQKPVVLERRKPVANVVTPAELKVLEGLYREVKEGLGYHKLDERRAKLWEPARVKVRDAMKRLEQAFADEGEPQGFLADELGALELLYTCGLYVMTTLAAGSPAHDQVLAAMKPAMPIVQRLCPGKKIEAPDPAKYDAMVRKAAEEKKAAEQAERARQEAEAARLAREAEEAKNKGLGRFFKRG